MFLFRVIVCKTSERGYLLAMKVPRACVDALLSDGSTPVSRVSDMARLALYLLRYFTLTTLVAVVAFEWSPLLRRNVDLVFLTTFVVLYSTFVLTNAVLRVRIGHPACDTYLESAVSRAAAAALHVGMWLVGVWTYTVRHRPATATTFFSYAMDTRTLKSVVATVLFVAMSRSVDLYFPASDEEPDTRYRARRGEHSDVVMLLGSLAVCVLLWIMSIVATKAAAC